MIRAQVSWWPGNIDTGGVHVHHMVFGIVLMLLCGFLNFALDARERRGWRCSPRGFGIGAGLTLDEFALWLHLEDVYWADEGRQSIEATAIAVAIAAMVLLGVAPFDLQNQEGDVAVFAGVVIGNLLLVAVVLLKGKLTTAVLAAFIPLLALIGAMRLARPGSPWAKRRYEEPSEEAREGDRARPQVGAPPPAGDGPGRRGARPSPTRSRPSPLRRQAFDAARRSRPRVDGYTIPQVADLVGVSRQDVREAVESGLLPAVRRDGRWWLQPVDVETLRRRLEPPPPLHSVEESDDDDLAVLEEKITALEERVAALEAGEPPPPDDDRPMRSALTPLFKNPRR